MKPRIYKSGVYWIAESHGFKFAFFWFDAALAAVQRRFLNDSPLPAWVADTLEASHV